MAGDGRLRARIKAETMRLCVERGVDGASIRAIAKASGIRSASLYNHFPSREALLHELFREGFASYARRIREAGDFDARFRDRLEAMVDALCSLHEEDETLFSFLLLVQHAVLRGLPRDLDNPVGVLCREIADAMESGAIAQGDPVLVAAGVVGTLVQAATFRLYGRGTRSLGEMREDIVALCLRIVG